MAAAYSTGEDSEEEYLDDKIEVTVYDLAGDHSSSDEGPDFAAGPSRRSRVPKGISRTSKRSVAIDKGIKSVISQEPIVVPESDRTPAKSLCYPAVSKLMRGNIEDWETGRRIGYRSYFGNRLLETCRTGTDDCNYIVKYMEIKIPTELDYMKKEVKVAKLAGAHGIGPWIYDAWVCENAVVIVMERLQYELRTIFNATLDNDFRLRLIRQSFKALKKLHALGYCHNDLHMFNIMVNKQGKVKIIDFDRVSEYNEKGAEHELNWLQKDLINLIRDNRGRGIGEIAQERLEDAVKYYRYNS